MLIWDLFHVKGFSKQTLHYSYKLPSIKSPQRNEYLQIPISLSFKINYFILSGLKIKSMKV
jgi:hypothetical protein